MLPKNIDEYLKHLNYINSNSNIIDFGSNFSEVASFFDEKYSPNIFCYEPNIVCFNFLKKRFKNKKNIKIFNTVVSNYSGIGKLYFHKNASSNNDQRYITGATLRLEKDNIDQKKILMLK